MFLFDRYAAKAVTADEGAASTCGISLLVAGVVGL